MIKHRHVGKYRTRKGVIKRKPLHNISRASVKGKGFVMYDMNEYYNRPVIGKDLPIIMVGNRMMTLKELKAADRFVRSSSGGSGLSKKLEIEIAKGRLRKYNKKSEGI